MIIKTAQELIKKNHKKENIVKKKLAQLKNSMLYRRSLESMTSIYNIFETIELPLLSEKI